MSQAFATFNGTGHYPVPQIGASMIMANGKYGCNRVSHIIAIAVGSLLLFISALIICGQYRSLRKEKEYVQDMVVIVKQKRK